MRIPIAVRVAAALALTAALSACGGPARASGRLTAAPPSSPVAAPAPTDTATPTPSARPSTHAPTPTTAPPSTHPAAPPPTTAPVALSIQLAVAASPKVYAGPHCPGAATFRATVTVNRGPTTISYRWSYLAVGGDGLSGPVTSYTFAGSGVQHHVFQQPVTGIAQPAVRVDGKFTLLSPGTVRQSTAEYRQTCGAQAATPTPLLTSCPMFAHVTTYITTAVGPMTVTYHWLFSNGSRSTEESAAFPLTGAQHLKVTSPNKIMSEPFGASLVIDTPVAYSTALVHASC